MTRQLEMFGQSRSVEGCVHEAHSIFQQVIDEYKPDFTFAMFSGGHDSLCATHLAMTHCQVDTVVHINTGIGIEETREFVRNTCRQYGWPLREYCSPIKYDDLVLRDGFPGPPGHMMMYTRLKERCIRQLVKDYKTKRSQRPMLVGGMRQKESVRRMGHAEPCNLDEGRIWCSPITYWDDADKEWYMQANNLPHNPVVGRLCMSGECLCGAFAKPGELQEIEAAYPEAAKRIRDLEAKARAAGVHAQWGTKHPNSKCFRQDAPGQLGMFSLCSSCEFKHQQQEESEQLFAAGCRWLFGEAQWLCPDGEMRSHSEAVAWLESQQGKSDTSA